MLVHLSPAAADPRDPVRLRVGTQAIDGSRYMKDILSLGNEIEKRTRGSVQLDWVAGGQLGDEAAMADLIARGKLDGGGLSETGLIALVPEMVVWRSPGLVRTYEEVDRATTAVDAAVRELFARRGLTFRSKPAEQRLPPHCDVPHPGQRGAGRFVMRRAQLTALEPAAGTGDLGASSTARAVIRRRHVCSLYLAYWFSFRRHDDRRVRR